MFSYNASFVARILESLGELSQILDHRLTLKEAAKEEFLENSYTFYVRQIILPNIVLLRSSLTQDPCRFELPLKKN